MEKKITKVITYGTFDLFHEGHYRLLRRAKELGDYLIVGVTTEAYDKARGKLNVADSLVTRIENVKKTGFADEIIIEESAGQKVNDIRKFHGTCMCHPLADLYGKCNDNNQGKDINPADDHNVIVPG